MRKLLQKTQQFKVGVTEHLNKTSTPSLKHKTLPLTTQTICFSKSTLMHDTVIELVINNFEFGFIDSPNETTKTCRDIGACKRYARVKNDPIWLAYQRAYKAHYARVSKKRITKP